MNIGSLRARVRRLEATFARNHGDDVDALIRSMPLEVLFGLAGAGDAQRRGPVAARYDALVNELGPYCANEHELLLRALQRTTDTLVEAVK